MDSNKSLISKTNNPFTTIVKFFKRLFKVKETNVNVSEGTNLNGNARKTFLNSIKEEDDPEILRLQELYENDKIKAEQLSYGQILILNKLYDKQIAKIKEDLNIKKVQLEILEKKIAN